MRQVKTDRRALCTRRMLMQAMVELTMVTSMLITVIQRWIEDGLSTPAETVDHMFHLVANAVIDAGLEPGPRTP